MKKVQLYILCLVLVLQAKTNASFAGLLVSKNDFKISVSSNSVTADNIHMYLYGFTPHHLRGKIDAVEYSFSDFGNAGSLIIPDVRVRKYILFETPNNDINKKLHFLFVNPGDSVNASLNENEIIFTGRGAEKLNCLLKIARLDVFVILKEFKQSPEWIEYIRSQDSLLNSIGDRELTVYNSMVAGTFYMNCLFKIRVNILNEFKSKMSKSDYDIIYQYCLTERYLSVLKQLSAWETRDEPTIRAKLKYYNEYIKNKPFIIKDESIASFVYSYDQYAFNKLIIKLFYEDSTFNIDGRPFEKVLKEIKADYGKSGPVFDRIVMEAIANNKYYNFNGIDSLYDTLEFLVKQPDDKKIIRSYKTQTKGSPFYPFVLSNILNKKVTLNELKGKLLIVDFWFTGCTNCVKLTKAIEPIYEKYKNSSEVLFVSINCDNDSSMWRGSLKTGIKLLDGFYSHDKSLNLTLAPQGFLHNLTKFYGITGAPILYLVDKEGKMLEAHPPRPVLGRDDNTIALGKIIEKYLLQSK